MDYHCWGCPLLYGSLATRVVSRALFVACAISAIPLLLNLSGSDLGLFDGGECVIKTFGDSGPNVSSNPLINLVWGSTGTMQCEATMNFTVTVVRELLDMQMLSRDAKALCVGEGAAAAVLALREMGFSNALGVHRHPIFSLKRKQLVYELNYDDDSFDFVFSRDLDEVSVPALRVLEVERLLKPGGIGAMLVGATDLDGNSLIRSATRVSSLLKSSNVVHVGSLNGSVLSDANAYTLVVFKKRSQLLTYFQQILLPADCPSLLNYRPFLHNLEPLLQKKPMHLEKPAYLPNYVDVSAKKRLVYVDIGAGMHVDANSNVTDWWLPSYPLSREAFNVYFVDHNTSVLLSYVKKPGVTFVYHPGLAGTRAAVDAADDGDSDSDMYVGDEGFDFLAWFKETVRYADFVVLKMNAGNVELNFLLQLFQSGAICFVDELFLHCSEPVDVNYVKSGDCIDLLNGLRTSGVFVHQWWGE